MKLLFYPDEWLTKEVKPFDFEKQDAKVIENQMITLMNLSKGVGLAANQVGLDSQIFVMTNKYGEKFSIINPTVIAASKEIVEGDEGCLSFPGLILKVKRAQSIAVEFYDPKGDKQNLEFTDWDARVFQHEFDHLFGVNFINRVSKLRLDRAKKKQEKLFKKVLKDYKNKK
jgi:peptide deformylase|tara:strand:- start:559 stop:1071 length:513 start_codon:yes stop_codon:yes gene_type:complete